MKLFKFKADWCSPCRVLATTLDGFNECPMEDVNVDLDPDKTTQYGIRSLPTLVLLDDEDQEIWRHTGMIDRMKLESVVQKLKKK